MKSPAFALINLNAGGCEPDRFEDELRATAVEHGVELEVCRTKKDKRKKSRRAIKDGFKTIIAVGGDGTVSKVASEAAGSSVAMGIVPAGTANLLAKELGLPGDCSNAIRLLFGDHKRQSLDGMKVGKHTMFSHVSMGTYSRIAAENDSTAKKRFGRGFYLWQAFQELRDANKWRFQLEVDGEPVTKRASLVLLANICPVGIAGMTWGDHIRPDDGKIDVCIVRAVGMKQHLGLMYNALQGRTATSPQIDYLTARESIAISASSELPVRADGKVIDEGEVKIKIVPSAVQVIIPNSPPED